MFKIIGGKLHHKKLKMSDSGASAVVPGTLLKWTADGLVTLSSSEDLSSLNGIVYMAVDYYKNAYANGYIGVVNVQSEFEAHINSSHIGEAVSLGSILTIRDGKWTIADTTGDVVCAVVEEANSSTATTATWKITTRCFQYALAASV